jgi:hypothetical protein
MIELATDVGLLRRFVTELADTSPRPVPRAPDLAAYGEADREAARLAWASRIVDEYRSVAVFAELLQLLTDLEAPFAELCAVQRLIGDELRHTQLTAQVVDWLGGRADLAIDLSAVGLPPRDADESPAARASRIIARELVVAEEESVYVLIAYRDAAREPAIRAVFELVLADEVRHAAVGRALLARFADGALATMMADDRAALRADYLRSARGGPGRALGASIEQADLEAIWRRLD